MSEPRGFYSDRDRFGRKITRPITVAALAGPKAAKTKVVRLVHREQAESHVGNLSDVDTEQHLIAEHGIDEDRLFFKINPPSRPTPRRESVIAMHRRLHGLLPGSMPAPKIEKDKVSDFDIMFRTARGIEHEKMTAKKRVPVPVRIV